MQTARIASGSGQTTARLVLAATPMVLLVATLGFSTGGYYPGAAEIVLCGLAVALAGWLLVADRPVRSFGLPLAIAVGSLAALSLWIVLSALWSDAPGRAALEFSRALLYLLALVLGGVLGGSVAHARWLVRLAVLGGVAVCVAGLMSRVAPDLIDTAPQFDSSRLSFPITYWNGLGAIAAITIILAAAIVSDAREHLAMRAAAAAVTPVVAATLVLTLARGPSGAAAVGLLIVIVVGFGRGTLTALITAGVASAVAVVAALDADLLTSHDYATRAGIEAGHHLGWIVAAAAGGAAIGVIVLRPLERLLPARVPRAVWIPAAGALVVAALVAAVAAGAPGYVEDSYDEFVDVASVDAGQDQGDRLLQFSNNGRLDHWRAAMDGFEQEPLHGTGAGTYQITWDHQRGTQGRVRDAHSLYMETLSELGIVGAVLLAVPLGLALFWFFRRARGEARTLYAGLGAAFATWLIMAGVDWLWELPAVTAWMLFAAGAVLATPTAGGRRSPWLPRIAGVLVLAVLCVIPIRVALSQSPLERARHALHAGNCRQAVDASLSSLSAFDDRPAPYAILGYCDVRDGSPQLGAKMMRKAVDLDPHNWSYRYGLALVNAFAGRDPRAQALLARRLNPRSPVTQAAAAAFDTGTARAWKRRAGRLPIPFEELR